MYRDYPSRKQKVFVLLENVRLMAFEIIEAQKRAIQCHMQMYIDPLLMDFQRSCQTMHGQTQTIEIRAT